MISGSGSLTKIGTGTLMLVASQAYSGPTVIAAGTLRLGAIGGFGGNGSGFTINSSGIGSPAVTGGTLTLTDNNGNEARTAFYDWKVPVTSPFTARFVYQDVTASAGNQGDGVVFVLQNDSRGLGAGRRRRLLWL